MYLLTALRSLSWNSIDLTKELTVSTKATKKNFINLQWVVALGTSYLLFSGSNPLAESPWELTIIAILLASVLVLYNLPPSVFSQTIFTCVLTMTDTLFVVVGIALSKESPWDLFLILFFGLFIAAIGESFIKIVCGCLLMSFVFVVFAAYQAGNLSIYDFELFRKIPFIIGNFLLLGYLAEQVKQEKAISKQRQGILYEINLTLTSTLDLRVVLDVLLEKIKTLLPYSAATITLLNKGTGIFEPIACWNISESNWKSIPNIESDLDDASVTNAPVVVRKAQANIPSPTFEFLQKEGLVSYLRVPLVVREEALGSLTLFTKEEREFDKTAMESGSIKVDRQEINLDDFLAEMRASHENPLRKELSLIWDYPPDLPIIRTDSHKLKLILQNLINNAIKYTPTGYIKISAHYFAEQKEVKFAVADTGIGIPKDSLTMIFDKFRQLGGSEANNYGGLVLGLYIFTQYIEVIGGRVDVESELGKGSIFAVTLPVRTSAN